MSFGIMGVDIQLSLILRGIIIGISLGLVLFLIVILDYIDVEKLVKDRVIFKGKEKMNELSLFVAIWTCSGLLGTLWKGYNHWKDGNNITLVEVVGAIFVGSIFGCLVLGFVFTEKFGNKVFIKGRKRDE